MSGALKIREVQIDSVRGFHHGMPAHEFADQLNIIYGPNASGKTTLTHVLQWFLWPQQADAATIARARWQDDHDEYNVRLMGAWSDRSFAAGEVSRAAWYRLAQHELLNDTQHDERLCQEILKEARGGLDLSVVTSEKYQWPRTAINSLSEAAKRLSEIDQLRSANVWENQRRNLIKEIDKCSRLISDKEAIESQLKLCQVQQAVEELQSRLAAFDTRFDLLHPDDLKRFVEKRDRLNNLNQSLRSSQERRDHAQDELRAIGLPDLENARSCLPVLEELLREARQLQRDYEDAERACTRAQEGVEGLRRQLAAQPLPNADPLSLEEWYRVLNALEQAAGTDAKLQAVRELRRRIDALAASVEAPAKTTEEALNAALRATLSWLSAPAATAWPWIPIVIGILSIIVLVYALIEKNTALPITMGFISILILAVWDVIYATRARKQLTRDKLDGEVRNHLAEIKLGIPAPTVDSVLQTVQAIARRMQQLQMETKLDEIRKELESNEAEQNGVLSQCYEVIRQSLEHSGLSAPDLNVWSAARMASLLRLWIDWVECNREWQEAEAERRKRAEQLQAVVKQLFGRLAEIQSSISIDVSWEYRRIVPELEAAVDDLRSRVSRAEQLVQQLNTENEKIGELEMQIDAAERDLESFLSPLDLTADDADSLLRSWLNDLPEYSRIKKELAEAKIGCELLESELKAMPAATQYKDQSIESLRRALEKVEEATKQRDQYLNDQGRLEKDIENAKKSADYEAALRDCQQKVDELHKTLCDRLHRHTVCELAAALKDLDDQQRMPDVFKRADAFFKEFTNHRYHLKIDALNEAFSAVDTSDRVLRSLSELSSATRIHLLMAVRLAYIEQSERDLKLPLFLDETLACTDAEREREIIEAVLKVAQSGRQVFYLTSKPREADAWQQLAEEQGVSVQRIDLGDTPSEWVISRPPEANELPAPEGLAHADYGERLEVPRWHPRRDPAEAAHPWYVVDDTHHLYLLLAEGVNRLGPMKSLLQTPECIGIPSTQARRYLALASTMELIQDAARVGHGEPVRPELLDDIKTSKKAQLLELLQQENFDGTAFLNALTDKKRISGLQQRIVDALRDKLEQAGCVSDTEPMSLEAQLDWVLQQSLPRYGECLQSGDVKALFDRVWPAVDGV